MVGVAAVASYEHAYALALARWLLGLGIAATLAANATHGLEHGLIGAAVAAWSAVALVGSDELLMIVAGRGCTGIHSRACGRARALGARDPRTDACGAVACPVATCTPGLTERAEQAGPVPPSSCCDSSHPVGLLTEAPRQTVQNIRLIWCRPAPWAAGCNGTEQADLSAGAATFALPPRLACCRTTARYRRVRPCYRLQRAGLVIAAVYNVVAGPHTKISQSSTPLSPRRHGGCTAVGLSRLSQPAAGNAACIAADYHDAQEVGLSNPARTGPPPAPTGAV